MIDQLFRKKSLSSILKLKDEAKPMNRNLGVVDLTSLGIAAIIGAGIFSTIGNAAFNGGPGVVFLFIFTAIACSFSALCYAEFASNVPISGSAYTYAYISMGELVAWIIGWALLMEYAVGNIAVAISWSDYFTSLLASYNIQIPLNFTMDYLTAKNANLVVSALLEEGHTLASVRDLGITQGQVEGYLAWNQASSLGPLRFIADLPALFLTILTTVVCYLGIRESKRVSNVMVLVKLIVIFLVIVVGLYYVRPENWVPFTPNGASGILKGVSAVFFAYIGFDAISTTAEECKNPERDLPRAMIYCLLICTAIYIAVALVLTGIVSYQDLAVGDPLAFVFGANGANVPWIYHTVSFSAIIALFTVMLVFQLGQPRIWMAMSRDGLLPPKFSEIHPKYKVPWFSTIVTGAFVAIPCLFFNLVEMTDLTSIGTLWAFVLVCFGALSMDPHRPKEPGKFRLYYVNGKFIFPAILLLVLAVVLISNPQLLSNFFSLTSDDPAETKWDVFKHKIPLIVYMLAMVVLSIRGFTKNYSLIPLLGVATSGYLMTELGYLNWRNFGVWLIIGLVIYFLYGQKHSKIRHLKN
jgi:APA family basic amino acid/polyamine antiporter